MRLLTCIAALRAAQSPLYHTPRTSRGAYGQATKDLMALERPSMPILMASTYLYKCQPQRPSYEPPRPSYEPPRPSYEPPHPSYEPQREAGQSQQHPHTSLNAPSYEPQRCCTALSTTCKPPHPQRSRVNPNIDPTSLDAAHKA